MNKRVLILALMAVSLVSCGGGQAAANSATSTDEEKVIAQIGSGFTSLSGDITVRYDRSTKYFSSTLNQHNKYWVWAATVVFTWPNIRQGDYQSGGEGIGDNVGRSYRLSFSNIVLDNGDPRKISSYSYTTVSTNDSSGQESSYTAEHDAGLLSYCVSTFDFCCYQAGVSNLK